MRINALFFVTAGLILFFVCQSSIKRTSVEKGEYGFDLTFLGKELKVVELVNGDARMVVVPKYGGRVMTSSSRGLKGHSNGWINYDLITSQKTDHYSNPYGGEERLWLGPEGGQFSVFYAKEMLREKESGGSQRHWITKTSILKGWTRKASLWTRISNWKTNPGINLKSE